jgi:hypothetical protein
MAGQSTFLSDKLLDHANGVAAYTEPTVFVALFRATAGQSPRSTAVTSGQTTVPASPNGHMYRCTTGGTTGSGEPTWGTVSGGTTTDGTATWTEMTPDFLANNSNVTGTEANYTGYTREALSGLMGSAASGSASNSSAINFPAATGGTNVLCAFATYDASTVGNLLRFGELTATLSVSSGITPSFPISDMTTTMS